MKRISLYIICVLLAVFAATPSASALTPQQILDKAAKEMTVAPSLSVKFTTSGAYGNNNGSLTISGNKFQFAAGDISVWYNGKTQWALSRSAEEVSITEPTASELVESNPFTLISKHKQLFNAKLTSSTKNVYVVNLTPKNRHSQIRTATISIDARTFMPKSLDCTLSDNSKISVKVSSVSKGKALPASYFIFNPKAHPDLEVIDLR